MNIKGIDGMTMRELEEEVAEGGKFVFYLWVISLLVVTFKRPTDIYYVPPGHGRVGHAIGPTLLSCVTGWWGFPWGLIYTIQAIFTNLAGGKDVTDEVMDSMRRG